MYRGLDRGGVHVESAGPDARVTRHGKNRLLHAVPALLALLVSGCPNPGPAPRPPDLSKVRPAETVKVIESRGQPLIVDWQPEQRGDLEVAMREGIAVVSYTTAGLKLLRDCHIDGEYGFIGISKKEQIIRLVSEDEIKANLPLGGIGIAAQIGGELSQGAALDIAVVMVGKKRTTWEDVTRNDLHGACDGASHFVRGATIGAFAMSSGMKNRAQTVAQLFGAGIGASSSSASSVANRDGDVKNCEDANADSARPPSKCSALIRLELTPIKAEGASKPAEPKSPEEQKVAKVDESQTACPEGLVYSEGKCTKPTAQTTHACRYGDARDCKEQCEKENADSCDALGAMFFSGTNVAKDLTMSARLFALACEKGSSDACGNLGMMLENGIGVTKDLDKARALYLHACSEANAKACTAAGTLFLLGTGVPKDAHKGAVLMAKGCEGGSEEGCNGLGFLAMGGTGGLAKDEPLAARLFKKACVGGVAEACGNLAYMAEFGHGVTQDLKLAAMAYRKACEMVPRQCVWFGIATQIGRGVPVDLAKAKALYASSCNTGHVAACAALNVFWGERHPLDAGQFKAYVSMWTQQCEASVERDCASLAVLAQASGKQDLATRVAGRACLLGDAWGCSLLTLIHAPRPGQVPPAPKMADFGL